MQFLSVLLAFYAFFANQGVSSFVAKQQQKNPFLGNYKHHGARAAAAYSKSRSSSSSIIRLSASISADSFPRIAGEHIDALAKQKYVIIPGFLSSDLQEGLRNDVTTLQAQDKFKIAKIGQDSTNTLNRQIREAQTCFLGPTLTPKSSDREQLVQILQQVSNDLSQNAVLQSPKLDNNLNELLYAYYPQGGFYRRHRDAIPGSASVLRTYSLLLYLNKDWTETDGGYLRMHMDSGGDECPPGEEPNYLDVEPQGGTLVLFESDKIPHEVLDTNSERLAIVGWYNRELTPADIKDLGGGDIDPVRLGLLAVALALITVGVINLI